MPWREDVALILPMKIFVYKQRSENCFCDFINSFTYPSFKEFSRTSREEIAMGIFLEVSVIANEFVLLIYCIEWEQESTFKNCWVQRKLKFQINCVLWDFLGTLIRAWHTVLPTQSHRKFKWILLDFPFLFFPSIHRQNL